MGVTFWPQNQAERQNLNSTTTSPNALQIGLVVMEFKLLDDAFVNAPLCRKSDPHPLTLGPSTLTQNGHLSQKCVKSEDRHSTP